MFLRAIIMAKFGKKAEKNLAEGYISVSDLRPFRDRCPKYQACNFPFF